MRTMPKPLALTGSQKYNCKPSKVTDIQIVLFRCAFTVLNPQEIRRTMQIGLTAILS
jgi:hypothetical protein